MFRRRIRVVSDVVNEEGYRLVYYAERGESVKLRQAVPRWVLRVFAGIGRAFKRMRCR